jgi:hypothetical protein
MKAVIFDIDGTLIDSVDLHAKAWQDAFRYFGHEFAFEKIRSQIGKGGDQLMPVFLAKEEIEARGKEIEDYRGKLFKREYLHSVKAFPQVRALFERLLADGWKLALASSARKDELKTYQKIADIADLLDEAAGIGSARRLRGRGRLALRRRGRGQGGRAVGRLSLRWIPGGGFARGGLRNDLPGCDRPARTLCGIVIRPRASRQGMTRQRGE